ncbi:profilin-3-like [Leucoraja erinacea]|uniref:profilin-3-like n=1 Tax=Leucoraja erinaceus TaxID=7782 RepID=UPI0024583675|nr:profilin-3-like [Leucoraja erinacea]
MTGGEAMLDWKAYVAAVLQDSTIADIAIVGCTPKNKSIWACRSDGVFGRITSQEIEVIIDTDRKCILQNGITIGGKKYSIIRDNMLLENDPSMDIRTLGNEGMSICIGKSTKALMILMGQKGVHGGVINKKMHDMVDFLSRNGNI